MPGKGRKENVYLVVSRGDYVLNSPRLVILFPRGSRDEGEWQVSISKRLDYNSDLELINKTSQGSCNSMQKTESQTLVRAFGLGFQQNLLMKLLYVTSYLTW